jgi:hypothetical protein
LFRYLPFTLTRAIVGLEEFSFVCIPKENFRFFSYKKEFSTEGVAFSVILRSLSVADILITLHSYNVYLVIAVCLVTAVWGFVLFFMKRTTPKAWRIMLFICGGLALLQGLFGVSMVALGLHPGTGKDLYYLHYVYGAIVAFGLPVALTYATGGKDQRRDLLIFSIALLVMVAAGVRAWVTGPHP